MVKFTLKIIFIFLFQSICFGQDCKQELLEVFKTSIEKFDQLEQNIAIRYSINQKVKDQKEERLNFELYANAEKNYLICDDYSVYADQKLTVSISEKDKTIYVGNSLEESIKKDRIKNLFNFDYRMFDKLKVESCEETEDGKKRIVLICPEIWQSQLKVERVEYLYDQKTNQIIEAQINYPSDSMIQQMKIVIHEMSFESDNELLELNPQDFILEGDEIKLIYKDYVIEEIGTGQTIVQQNKSTN